MVTEATFSRPRVNWGNIYENALSSVKGYIIQGVITALPVRLTEMSWSHWHGSQDGSNRLHQGNGADPICPQHPLMVLPQSSNFESLIPTPAVENYPRDILTPFALTVFVRIVDLENRNKHLLVWILYHPPGSLNKIITSPLSLIYPIKRKAISDPKHESSLKLSTSQYLLQVFPSVYTSE